MRSQMWGQMLELDSVEYVIDISVHEQSALYEILDEVCQRFPDRSRQEHISFISSRLMRRALRGEITFFWWDDRPGTREVPVTDALALLQIPESWAIDDSQNLAAWENWNYDAMSPFTRWVRKWRTRILRRLGSRTEFLSTVVSGRSFAADGGFLLDC